jgi:hypothetical protein
LLAKGDDYALSYAVAQLREGEWKTIKPIQLPSYHNLRGLIPAAALSLKPEETFAGAAFSGYVATDSGPKGSRRSTIIGTTGIADVNAETVRNFDAVTDIAGTYVGKKLVAQFSLTKYDIQYHDFASNGLARTSQKRFSFMPAIFAFKSFFPLVIEDKAAEAGVGDSRLPGLFVPGDFIYSKATQVLAPSYENGRLRSIERPALFHLESNDCSALPTAKAADKNGPSELVFFCGDHFASVPLRY